jgi:hypothetical protein
LNHRAGSGRQVEASSAEHAGLCPCRALRRMRRISLAMCSVTASKDRYLCACECLLFEPTRRLGAAARGTTRPSTWRCLRCPRARRTRRCRSRCCICERTWKSGGGGTGPTPHNSERRSD